MWKHKHFLHSCLLNKCFTPLIIMYKNFLEKAVQITLSYKEIIIGYNYRDLYNNAIADIAKTASKILHFCSKYLDYER